MIPNYSMLMIAFWARWEVGVYKHLNLLYFLLYLHPFLYPNVVRPVWSFYLENKCNSTIPSKSYNHCSR